MRLTAFAVLLVCAVATPIASRADRSAHCSFDAKALTWRIGNDAIERTIRFETVAGGLETVRVKVHKAADRLVAVPGSEGAFTVAAGGAASANQIVSLARNWAYIWQAIGPTPDGGRTLTIHLQGVGPNAGWEAEAVYRAEPGRDAELAKALRLINRTGEPRLVTGVEMDRWTLASGRDARAGRVSPGASPRLVDPATGLTATVTLVGENLQLGDDARGGTALTVQAGANATLDGNGGRWAAPFYRLVVSRGERSGVLPPGGSTGRPRAPRGRRP